MTRLSAQGSPASTTIFLICGQILSDLMHNNTQITGLKIYGQEELMVQFANDTNIFLEMNQQSLSAVVRTLKIVYVQLGLKINYDKTVIYRLGSLRYSSAQLFMAEEVSWTNEPIKILGVKICEEKLLVQENFTEVIKKASGTLTTWLTRCLTLMGRTLLINSLVGSLFVYKMMVLPKLLKEAISGLNDIMRKFLWDSKKSKISLELLQADKMVGGLRLVNFNSKDILLKLLWVKHVHNNEFFRRTFYGQLTLTVDERIWQCNLGIKVAQNLCKSVFWGDVLVAWNELNRRNISSVRDMSEQIIWLNSYIKVDNKLLLNEQAWNAGLTAVADLFDGKSLLSFNELCSKFGPILSWFEHLQLVEAIPILWRQSITRDGTLVISTGHNIHRIQSMTAHSMYSDLVFDECIVTSKHNRWERIFSEDIPEKEFQDTFKALYKITIVTTYRDFQYRLLTHAIVTNRSLKIWKIRETDLCTFCNLEVETYTHLFYHCEIIFPLWDNLIHILRQRYQISDLELSVKNIIFNLVHHKENHIYNFIILIFKKLIYKCRCLGTIPSLFQLFHEVEQVYKIEEYLARCKNKWNHHVCKWRPLKPNLVFEENSFIDNYVAQL